MRVESAVDACHLTSNAGAVNLSAGCCVRNTPMRFEQLERRLLLSADGIAWGHNAYLSLSFAPDGTDVAGQPSSLFASFDQVAGRANWQAAILSAFQTWTQHTNADIGIVTDRGDAFGSAGKTQGDQRFGDIRVAAIPLQDGVFALSIPQDVVSGTWVGDIIFNSRADLDSVEEIFAVSLHEAGNVLGLQDNSNPNSPLFSGNGIPSAVEPTAADIAALESIFGQRVPDLNESDDSNDAFDDATRIRFTDELPTEGSAPSIIYGDVRVKDDVDVFRFDPVDDYTGPVTFEVRTQGISLLQPRLSLYDRDGRLLARQESTRIGGDVVSVRWEAVDPETRYFVRVEGATQGVFGVGGYALVTTHDGILQTDRATIDTLANGALRFLDQDEVQDFFDPDENEHLFNEDQGQNNTIDTATELDTSPGFTESTRYNSLGSFADEADVDFYRIRSPQVSDGELTVTIAMRSLAEAALVSSVALIDGSGVDLPGRVVVNEGGDHVVEFADVEQGQGLFVRVIPQPGQMANSGNYEMTISFDQEVVALEQLAEGQLTSASPAIQPWTVNQNQFVHFVLDVDAGQGASGSVTVAIRNSRGDVVVQLTAPTGSTRSKSSVLLRPDRYTINASTDVVGGLSLNYRLLALTISDPLAVLPDDPLHDPIPDCPNLDDDLCFPGDTNLDAIVTFDDFLALAANFGAEDVQWAEGDFDGDGKVSFVDFLLLAANFGKGPTRF